MKLIKWLISILFLVVVFSCTTTESSVVLTEEVAIEPIEKKMVEVEIEEKVYFTTKERVFYGDGQIDTITTYTYNDDYILLSKKQANEQDETLEMLVNTIENGSIVKQDTYGFGNVLNSYSIYEYDVNGNIIKETLFNSENKIQSVNEYEYDAGMKSKWRTLGPSGGVLAITDYVYDTDYNNVKIEIRDAGNTLDGLIEKTYVNGLISEEKILNSKGQLEKSIKYNYNGNTLVEKIYFDEKGNKKRSEGFEFTDSIPLPSKISLYFKSGALDAYTTLEYDFKIVKSTILVEE